MEQVEEICDKIILVNKGQKVLDNSVKGAKETFKENLFNVSLETNTDLQNGNTYKVITQKQNIATIKLREGITPNLAIAELIQHNIGLNGFQELLPSLNDIFIKIVGATPTARQFAEIN
jgi:ABC-2 type transport system ATP-binding protein